MASTETARKRSGSKGSRKSRGSDKSSKRRHRVGSLVSHGSARVMMPHRDSVWATSKLPSSLYLWHREPEMTRLDPWHSVSRNSECRVDVLVLCALPIERLGVLHILDTYRGERRIVKTRVAGFTCYLGSIPRHHGSLSTPDEASYDVAVARQHEMGSAGAAEAVVRLIRRFRPTAVVTAGIAAGIDRSVVGLGDVIVVEDAISAEPGSNEHQAAGDGLQRAYQAAREEISKWASTVPRPGGSGEQDTIRVHAGAMAVGSTVVRSGSVRDELKHRVPSAIGVEMEALPLARALRRVGIHEWLMVKTVVDYADHGDSKDSQWFGSLASAVVLRHVLARASLPRPATQANVLKKIMLPPEAFYLPDKDLVSTLNASLRKPTVPVVIAGTGGRGKSSLAVHLAWNQVEQRGQCPAVFLNAETQETILASVREAVVAQEILTRIPDNVGDDTLRSLLMETDPLPPVFVLDNVTDPAIVQPWLPPADKCAVIITTRNADIWRGKQVRLVQMPDMSPAEAARVLVDLSALPISAAQKPVQQLAGLLELQPLLLTLAARYMSQRSAESSDVSADELVQQVLAVVQTAGSSDAKLAAIVALAMQQMREGSLEHTLAMHVCFYAPNYVPVAQLVRPLVKAKTKSANDVPNALRRLTKYGLISSDTRTTIAMHRRIAVVMRRNNPHALHAIEAVASSLDASVETSGAGAVSYEEAAGVLPHVMPVLQHAAEALAKPVPASAAVSVLHAAARHCVDAANLRGAEQYAQRALTHAEAHGGKSGACVAPILATLARVRMDRNQGPEAVQLLERAIKIAEATYNTAEESKKYLAWHYLKLSIIRLRQGEVEQACRAQERGLALTEGRNEDSQLHARSGLLSQKALVLQRQGKEEEALAAVRRSFDAVEKAYGRRHALTTTSLLLLAQMQMQSSQTGAKQALAACLEAQKIRERVYGPDHVEVAYVLRVMARVYMKMKEFTKARQVLDRACTIFKQSYGDKHVMVARTLYQRAESYMKEKQDALAVAALDQALAILQHVAKQASNSDVGAEQYLWTLEKADALARAGQPHVEQYRAALALARAHYGLDSKEAKLVEEKLK